MPFKFKDGSTLVPVLPLEPDLEGKGAAALGGEMDGTGGSAVLEVL